MKSYFTFLLKNKFYTFVTVFGLAVSLMFVFLITVYAVQEFSVDYSLDKKDRIYFLGDENYARSAYGLKDRLREKFPEIEDITAITNRRSVAYPSVRIDNNNWDANITFVESNFFNFFSYSLIFGNKDKIFESNNSVVISESFSKKVFPRKNPLGESFYLGDNIPLTVSGVIEDNENSVIPQTDIFMSIDWARYFNETVSREVLDNAGAVVLAVLEREGTHLKLKEEEFKKYFEEFYWPYQREYSKEVKFYPLQDFYINGVSSNGLLRTGNKSLVFLVISIGIVILLFALFNYLNLTMAQTGFRSKEMATRRLVGAGVKEPCFRMILESILLTFISLFIGIFLAYLFQSVANQLLNTDLRLNSFFSFSNILIMVFFTIILGILSGLLPALALSKINPVNVMKGTFSLKVKMGFGKVFIIIQNVITITLVTVSLLMYNQINYMIDAPLGYNYKNMMQIWAWQVEDQSVLRTFISEVKKETFVKRVGLTEGGAPHSLETYTTVNYNDKTINLWLLQGDSVFLDMMGFKILKENKVSLTEKHYLNEQAYTQFELSEDALLIPYINSPLEGKIENFKTSVNVDIPAVMLTIKDYTQLVPTRMLIEIHGDPVFAYDRIKELYEDITGQNFSTYFMEEEITNVFMPEKKLLKIVALFCGIALLISLLGLLAISLYFIQQRNREIAIEKVFGSTNEQILQKLISSFLNYVLIAFIIAIPISLYIMQEWISSYSYRISITPVYFILGGLFCLTVSLFTVFFQSYRAAITNPVKTLKNE